MALDQQILAYVGLGIISYVFSKLLIMLYQVYFAQGISLTQFGADDGFWAVVTGGTDGIGKELAVELSKRGFNLVLISRTQEKLEAVQKEIEANGRKAEVLAVDFSRPSADDWARIEATMSRLRIGVLVNNVGLSHEFPKPLTEESLERCEAILAINVSAMVRMTKLALPQMQARRRGLVINVGSFAALVPSPFLSVYAGSKAFVKSFTQAVGGEMRPHGVTVQYLNTYFVCSKMSKIRRPSFAIPSASTYARAVLAKIGLSCGSYEPFCSVPFPAHALVCFAVERFASLSMVLKANYKNTLAIRNRALGKRKAQ